MSQQISNLKRKANKTQNNYHWLMISGSKKAHTLNPWKARTPWTLHWSSRSSRKARQKRGKSSARLKKSRSTKIRPLRRMFRVDSFIFRIIIESFLVDFMWIMYIFLEFLILLNFFPEKSPQYIIKWTVDWKHSSDRELPQTFLVLFVTIWYLKNLTHVLGVLIVQRLISVYGVSSIRVGFS